MGNSIAAWPSNREAIDVENPTKGWIILKNSIAKTTTKVWSIRWASTSNVETTLFLKVKLAILINQTYYIQSFVDSLEYINVHFKGFNATCDVGSEIDPSSGLCRKSSSEGKFAEL